MAPHLKEQLERIGAMQAVDDKIDEGRVNALSSALATLEGEVREQLQAVTAAEIPPVIDTLRADGPIGPRELELIRLWIVGDADSYVKMETDAPGWIAELARLLGVLRQLGREAMTRPLWVAWTPPSVMPSGWPATSCSTDSRRNGSGRSRTPPDC